MERVVFKIDNAGIIDYPSGKTKRLEPPPPHHTICENKFQVY